MEPAWVKNLQNRKPWKKGQSGNPKGRPKGIKNGEGAARRVKALKSQAVAEVEKQLKSKDPAERMAAARQVLEWTMPRPKPRAQPVKMPGLAEIPEDKRHEAIVEAVSAGKLNIEEGEKLASLVRNGKIGLEAGAPGSGVVFNITLQSPTSSGPGQTLTTPKINDLEQIVEVADADNAVDKDIHRLLE